MAQRTRKAPQKSKKPFSSVVDEMSLEDVTEVIRRATARRETLLESATKKLIAEFRAKAERIGIDPEVVVGGGTKGPVQRRGKVAPKYRGPGGEEWSGRGKPPTWLAKLEREGRSREQFLIKR